MTHESYSDEAPLKPTSSSEQALTKGGPWPPLPAKKIGIIFEKITSRGQVGMHGEASPRCRRRKKIPQIKTPMNSSGAGARNPLQDPFFEYFFEFSKPSSKHLLTNSEA